LRLLLLLSVGKGIWSVDARFRYDSFARRVLRVSRSFRGMTGRWVKERCGGKYEDSNDEGTNETGARKVETKEVEGEWRKDIPDV
jgi:hypothetical protein